MYNDVVTDIPKGFADIESASQSIGFSMPSDLQTGALLQTLAGSKPKGNLLEIGTGTGLATAWLLASMDTNSSQRVLRAISGKCISNVRGAFEDFIVNNK